MHPIGLARCGARARTDHLTPTRAYSRVVTLEAMPLALAPMLASPGRLPHGDEWSYEVKWDGYRAIAAIDPHGATPLRLWTRAGNDATTMFPEIGPLADALAVPCVLDGEIVAFDEHGRPSFHRIQERNVTRASDALVRAQRIPCVYVVFDIVHLDGHSTRSLPLSNRRQLLAQLGLDTGATWRTSTVYDDGQALHDATRDAGIEGVVAKRRSSVYSSGVRSPAWIKVRHLKLEDFVIAGWVPGEGRRQRTIGALLLGQWETDDGIADGTAPLRWVGKVGTGFTDAELDRLHALLAPDRIDANPFLNDPGERTAVYVAPKHRCHVEYGEWSPLGILRFPSYKGLVAAT
jgi:bifunctional non-homologous end joining protein LigD